MDQPLVGKKILILIASGFEETDFTETQRALLKTGAQLKTASVDSGLVNSWHGNGWGHYFTIDSSINEILASDFDGLFIPGGERSLFKLKQSAHSRRIINNFLDGSKPLAAMGEGVTLLTVAGTKLKGRTLAGPESAKQAISDCGAVWTDLPLHADRQVISARNVESVAEFAQTFVQILAAQTVLTEAA